MYFSTFISGTEEVVKKALKSSLSSVEILLVLDGLIVYKTESDINEIINCRFLNNSFILLKQFNRSVESSKLVEYLLSDQSHLGAAKRIIDPGKSVRIITSFRNQTIALEKNKLIKLEEIVCKKLNLKINRSLPDYEIWLITRDDEFSFIGLRFTSSKNPHTKLHQGELRSELANILCLTAEIENNELVLDPFAGYGAIVFECSEYFKARQIIGLENNEQVFKILKNKTKHLDNVKVHNVDAFNNQIVKDRSIDKIITDPPWGIYDDSLDKYDFYNRLFGELKRILKNNSTVVLLATRDNNIKTMLDKWSNFNLTDEYAILVSGKKASIYKLNFIL